MSETILKIGQCLIKLWQKLNGLFL